MGIDSFSFFLFKYRNITLIKRNFACYCCWYPFISASASRSQSINSSYDDDNNPFGNKLKREFWFAIPASQVRKLYDFPSFFNFFYQASHIEFTRSFPPLFPWNRRIVTVNCYVNGRMLFWQFTLTFFLKTVFSHCRPITSIIFSYSGLPISTVRWEYWLFLLCHRGLSETVATRTSCKW